MSNKYARMQNKDVENQDKGKMNDSVGRNKRDLEMSKLCCGLYSQKEFH